ncbi:MAG: DNA polymerase III subunit gamma/tau [Robiginitomaculum sp.]|nr:DNA polymerase III subunit gamma/tau [Robiginitomaculum sp.]
MTDTADSNISYKVLARKYRPMCFEDMIGQEAMVKTLTNAFKVGRVAHAFMLTGVRGIGKTTTARLLARALNYEGQEGSGLEGPSVKLNPEGIHCDAINKSSHMDVMEMDAASRTGVGDIREILDSVRYAPVSARYKIYIIDEVHMLSGAAFNALLKTLEEPPDHAKFIFATTEIRKIPITVLSRCQRFDLRRVEAGELTDHLAGICEKENADIARDGLALIARASEGSVRDGLSLLDQAIVQAQDGAQVSADHIRTMLGLADRGRVLDLFGHAAKGDAKQALREVRSQYNDGAEPSVIVRDLLDICHEISRAKILGADCEFDAAPDHIAHLHGLAETLSMGQITRLWQMLLTAYGDVREAPEPLAAAEMAVLRMAVASDLPPPELGAQVLEGLKNIKDAPAQATPKSQLTPPASPVSTAQDIPAAMGNVQTKPVLELRAEPAQSEKIVPSSLEELVAGMHNTETALKYEIRQYVRPVLFETGKIIFEPAPNSPMDLAPRIAKYLQNVTSTSWKILADPDAKGAPSLIEARKLLNKKRDAYEQAHPLIAKAEKLFPGVEVVFRDRPKISNVIEADINKDEK